MLFVVLTSLVAMNEPAPSCAQLDAHTAPVERTVTVHVKPWADVFVDGALVARTAKRAHLSLAVGEHVIVFRNPAALEEARTIVVPSMGATPQLHVELNRRPAHMTVNSNVADAEVEVCLPHIDADATRERPITLPLMDSPATVEVRVSRRGFSTVTRRIEVEAGRPVRVDVHLAPDDAR